MHEAVIDAMQERLDRYPEKMRVRQQTDATRVRRARQVWDGESVLRAPTRVPNANYRGVSVA